MADFYFSIFSYGDMCVYQVYVQFLVLIYALTHRHLPILYRNIKIGPRRAFFNAGIKKKT